MLKYGKLRRTIVGKGAAHADDEASTTSSERAPSGAVVRVLPHHAIIFFVNANRVFNLDSTSVISDITSRLPLYQRHPKNRTWDRLTK